MSVHENLDREEAVQGSSDRTFGLVFTVVFLALGLWPLWKGGAVHYWSLGVGAAFLILSFARPTLLGPLNRLWMKFGLLLNRIVSPVILGILFFLVVTPTGLLMRLFGGNPLRLGFDSKEKSYWIKRDPPGPDPKTMSNQF